MTPEVDAPTLGSGWRPRAAEAPERTHAARPLSLKAFWEAVGARLGAASLEELRTVLRAMASRVHPSERQAFLESLSPVPDARQEVLERALQDKLLADITEQARRLDERQEEVDSGGYDYGADDDDFGPGPYVEFVAPVTALFARAQRAFERGRLPLARDAYRRLFALLRREDDYGVGLRLEHLEEVDVPESRARYLRALYETTSPERRAEALLAAMNEVGSWDFRRKPMLVDVRDISPEPLPDLETFLPTWEALLRQQEDDPVAEAWLREATGLSRGVQGLHELARTGQHPRAWVNLLALLEHEGPPREVLDTAHEALKALPAGMPLRARVADFLASAAERLGHPVQVREAHWEAFVACPGLRRLLDLRDCGEAEPERARLMKRAARHVGKALARQGDTESSVDDTELVEDDTEPPGWEEFPRPWDAADGPYPRLDAELLAHARLLGHDWQAAWESAARAEVLGWSSRDNPQGLVVPVLLLWLSGPSSPQGPSRSVEALWLKRLEGSLGYEPGSSEEGARALLSERLSRAYNEVLAVLSVSRPRQEEWLEGCLKVTQERARAIVREKYRRSYGKAALLLAACAEVLQRRGQQARAQEFLRRFREEFPRHSAFQAELDEALSAPSRRERADPPGPRTPLS
jgi:hypothetical protein